MENIKAKLKDRKTLLIIIGFLIVVVGVTLAYVIAQISDSVIGNTDVAADTTDNLKFAIDKDISLSINRENFGIGDGNLSDTSIATVTLLANSTTNNTTYEYNVYFRIFSNEYDYTTTDELPEIVLTITNPDGEIVTDVYGLNYVDAVNADGTVVSGFDITNASGLFEIELAYPIVSTSSLNATVHEWTFTATFINLDSDQTANTGKGMNAEIILSRVEEGYHEICEPGTMACDIARLYNEYALEDNGLYYHNGTIGPEICMYDEIVVLKYPDGTPLTNEEDCQRVFDYMGMGYFDASIITAGMEEGIVEKVTWNNETCVTTTSGLPVYIYANGNGQDVAQEQCNGYAVTADTRAIILTEVGSGIMGTYIVDAEDYSYRYSGGSDPSWQVSRNYSDVYSSFEELMNDLAYLGYYYNNTVYNITSDNGEGMYSLYEAIAIDYCEINNCNYEDVLNSILSGTDDVLMSNLETFLVEKQNSGEFKPEVIGFTYDPGFYAESEEEAFSKLQKDGYITYFSGINNYVCFGSIQNPCPDEYLYRIIGVFDENQDGEYQVKLIKADYTTSDMLGTDGRDYYGAYSASTSNYKGSLDTGTIAAYRWNYDTSVSSNGLNNWTTSELNTINLNTNYWNYLGATWQSLIAETTWHLGGMRSSSYIAKDFFDGERNNAGYGSNPTTYTDEIGLMYASDYGYAAYPNAWTTDIGDYVSSTIPTNNWLYMGLNEWTITPYSSGSYSVFYVYNSGRLNSTSASNGYSARPVFYLESNVQLEGGSGSSADPYRIA